MIEFLVRIALVLLLLFNPIEKISNHVIILGLEIIVVFVLRYWYFMPVEEISKCCNMNKSKVETILFRTGNKLKE